MLCYIACRHEFHRKKLSLDELLNSVNRLRSANFWSGYRIREKLQVWIVGNFRHTCVLEQLYRTCARSCLSSPQVSLRCEYKSILVLTPHYVPIALNTAHIERGAADRKRERVITVKRGHERKEEEEEKKLDASARKWSNKQMPNENSSQWVGLASLTTAP